MANLDFLNKEKLTTGFGNVITDAKTYDDVLVQAGLNWTVNAHPMYTEVDGTQIVVPNMNVIVRNEDMKPLGVVSNKYKIVNNTDAFAFTESIFNSKEIEFIRGGSFRDGRSTWLEAKITGEFSILGDTTDCYLVFKNSHDGTGAVNCFIIPTRIACSNALNFASKKAPRTWRCSHMGSPLEKIKEAQSVLLAGSTYMNAINEEAEVLNNIKLSTRQITQFIERLFPINDDMTERAKENCILRRSQLMTVYIEKDDLANFDDTGYKFVSAVVDYVNHVNGKNTKTAALNRFMSVASGNPLVDKAYDMVMTA